MWRCLPFLLCVFALEACVEEPSDSALDADTQGVDVRSSSDTPGDSTEDTSAPDTAPETDLGGDTRDAEQAPFVLEARSAVGELGGLVLDHNHPHDASTCIPTPGLDCTDGDQDGLLDAFEQLVLKRFLPVLRFDEDEGLFTDTDAVLAAVGRVEPLSTDPLSLRVYIMLGYSRDYGSCGFTAHNGDSERVVLELEARDAGLSMIRAYTAAHEGTATDHGSLIDTDALDTLVFEEHSGVMRWIVFPSANKHATYPSIDVCEGISPLPCIDEDCAPDNVSNPADFDRLLPVYNAGEDNARLLDALDAVGFPGDSAWANQPFCGGLGGSGCSSAVREKLLVDPF